MKKKFGGILQDRLLIGGILLILQMVLMVLCITFLSSKWFVLYRVFEVLSIIMVIWLIRKYDNPAYKIAWIIVILLFPLFGGIFYLFWGNTPVNRARTMHKIEKLDPDYTDKPLTPATERLEHVMPHYARRARYIESICGCPAWGGSQAEYFRSGEEQFASMKVELAKAERFIFMEYFILEEGEMWNTILDILVQKVQEGVDVRVMYDDAGCISKLPWKYDDYLCSLGIQTVRFNKFIPTLNTYLNNRDHRKICVIDGNVGYMGGINLADEYINKTVRFGYWKDTAVLVRGEAVANMTEMFLQLWQFSTGKYVGDHAAYLPTASWPSDSFVQPFGDSPMDNFNVSETVYMQIVNNAQRYVYITTPYLVLDNEMLTALTTAAQSGVDVRIVTPGIPDKPAVYAVTRSFYQQLIRAGVKIYEYRPGFIHAKMVVADDDVAVVGTINMDFRSFFLHFECGTVFYSGNIPQAVRIDVEDCIAQSREIDEEWIRRMPWPLSIVASILRVFSPLL
ncbi:cardiolipin synthase [Intestinibacillus massiliensis]|uniref:cardiolipin synthase n=1 Tax=Intestinibacillus massiliensis TaxID=1871029 RepID=UPI000B36149E|nr:cardiolipin synthase [Intestinibacillus massiliensis]